jgi:hypothetical protein
MGARFFGHDEITNTRHEGVKKSLPLAKQAIIEWKESLKDQSKVSCRVINWAGRVYVLSRYRHYNVWKADK